MKYFVLIAALLFSGSLLGVQSDLPLDQAARDGNVEQVERLLVLGSDPNARNKWGTTALTGAASAFAIDHEVQTKIIRLLLANGADANMQVTDGTTAINEASYWGNESAVRALIDAKASVDIPRDNGYTALLSAASRGHLPIVQLLIAAGADTNHQTRDGMTALHLASSSGYKHVASALLASGARTDLKNVRGDSYLEVAGRSAELQSAISDVVSEQQSAKKNALVPSGAISMTATELILSFIFTWFVVLVPPAAIRAIRGRPLGNVTAIVLCATFYFGNLILFIALGSTSRSHGALSLGAFVSYYIFRWQTKSSAERLVKEQRKKLGYDD